MRWQSGALAAVGQMEQRGLVPPAGVGAAEGRSGSKRRAGRQEAGAIQHKVWSEEQSGET